MSAYESLHGARRFPESAPDSETVAAERAADLRSTVAQMRFDGDTRTAPWVTFSACRDADPELFMPDGDAAPAAVAAATAWCDRCPVIGPCRVRRYQLGASGVWGGVNYRDADKGARLCATEGCSKPVVNPKNGFCGWGHEHGAKVGTRRGYDLHIREKETPCALCKEAARVDRAAHRKSTAAGGQRLLRDSGPSPIDGIATIRNLRRGRKAAKV